MRFVIVSIMLIAVGNVGALAGGGSSSGNGGGMKPNVYFSGSVMDEATGDYRGAYWANGRRVDFPLQSVASDIDVTDGHVYVAGTALLHGKNLPVYWLDGVLQVLPNADEITFIRASRAIGGHYYLVSSRAGEGLVSATLWIDGKDVPLAIPPSMRGAYGRSIDVDSDGHVYVAGMVFESRDVKNYHPGYWFDGVWVALPEPGPAPNYVSGIQVKDGHVYVSAVKQGMAAGYWLDGVWNDLITTRSASSLTVSPLSVSDGHVWAAATLYFQSDVLHIMPGLWKDGIWSDLPLPQNMTDGQVSSIFTSSDGHFVAGGSVCGWNSKNERTCLPGYWFDGNWKSFPNSIEGGVFSMAVEWVEDQTKPIHGGIENEDASLGAFIRDDDRVRGDGRRRNP